MITGICVQPIHAAVSNQDNVESAIEETSFYESIVPFDRSEMYYVFYCSISENNSELNESEIISLANELVDAAALAREQELQSSFSQQNSSAIQPVSISMQTESVSLGRIIDGKLIAESQNDDIVAANNDSPEFSLMATIPYSEYITLDSRTSIISHGFSVNPYQTSKVQWMTYGNWQGISQYTSSNYGAWYSPGDHSISKTLGYTGTLYASDARSNGLSAASSNTTYTQTVTTSDNFQINPWTAKYIRPIILWYLASYSAKYQFYCYNSYDNSYSYKTVTLTGENSTYDTRRNQAWVKVNTSQSTSASLPSLPSGFWLE